MTLTHIRCTDCGCKDVKAQRIYTIKHGEQRTIYACDACGGTFSSTSNTPMARLKTPMSVIAQVLSALTEGMGINAVTRLYGVSKNSIYRWQERLRDLKKRHFSFSIDVMQPFSGWLSFGKRLVMV